MGNKIEIDIPVLKISSTEGKAILADIEAGRDSRNDEVDSAVRTVLDSIRDGGDEALFSLAKKFDNRDLTSQTVRLSKEYIKSQAKKIDSKLAESIKEAAKRIEAYHKKQIRDGNFELETAEGVLSQIQLPLSRAGLYVPGGYTVYPSTVLMAGIPAIVAGVEEIVAVTPCRDGDLHPAIAFAFDLLNIYEVYQVGGAQAVAALAYGTESIKAVDKIVGPGNSYVATAKKMVYGTVDIDSIAGPSDIAILADSSANAEWVALDLLSQAEHGSGDETAVLVTEDEVFAQFVAEALKEEISISPVKDVFEKLPKNAIAIFVADSRKQSIEFINKLGPEHLEIITENPREDLKSVKNAAAIFLGQFTPVALGDYFIGTNHVLPTGGASRYASPLGVDSFLKRVSVAEVSQQGIDWCAENVSRFARSEGFVHHALSVERRVSK
jgi:histidinol dehydrogenase